MDIESKLDLSLITKEKWEIVKTIDAHTAGEPLRIVTSGIPKIEGKTILEKRKYMKDNFDHIRRALMWEPRFCKLL